MSAERWLPVPGHPRFEVSDLGRVKRLAYTQRRKHPKTLQVQGFEYATKILRGSLQEKGYIHVRLEDDATRKSVHRLVLLAFVGPCPDGMEGCHINGNPSDNKLANLRWDTPKENAGDRIRHGRQTKGATHPTAKFSDEAAAAVRAGTLNEAQAKAQHGMSRTHFYRIRRGEARS